MLKVHEADKAVNPKLEPKVQVKREGMLSISISHLHNHKPSHTE